MDQLEAPAFIIGDILLFMGFQVNGHFFRIRLLKKEIQQRCS
jgi:hypothetical protein